MKTSYKNYLLTLIIACSTLLTASATDLSGRIPANAGVVISVNSAAFSKKLGLEQLNKFEFMKKLNAKLSDDSTGNSDLFTQMFKSPDNAGIEVSQNSFFFLEIMDTIVVYSYVFALNDKAKFEKFVKDGIISQYTNKTIASSGSNKYYKADELFILWGKDFAQLIMIEDVENRNYKDPYYNYYNYSDINLSEEELAEQEKEKEKKIKKRNEEVIKHISSATQKPINTNNANYKIFAAEVCDIGVWANLGVYTSYYKELMKFATRDKMFREMFDEIDEFYKDNYVHTYITFESDQVKVKFRSFTSAKLKEKFGGMANFRVNPKFYEFIKKDSVMLLYGMSTDVNKVTMGTLDLYKEILSKDEEYGEKIAASLDLMTIIINFERLSKVFKGDFLISISGIKEYEREYMDYEYDEEYNRTMKWVKKKEKTAKFTAMLTAGNQEDLLRFINAFEKYEILEKVKDKDYYTFKYAGEGQQVYVALSNGILFVTNDDYLAQKDFKKGYSESERLNAPFTDMLNNNSTVFVIDFQMIADKMGKSIDKEDSVALGEWNEFKNVFRKLTITGMSENDQYSEANMVLLTKSTGRSSMVDILEYIDKALIREEKRDKAFQEQLEKEGYETAPAPVEYDYED